MDFEPPLNLISKTNELLDQCKKHIKLLNKKLDQCIQDQKKYNTVVFYSRRDLEKQYQIWKNEMIMEYGKDPYLQEIYIGFSQYEDLMYILKAVLKS